MEKVAVAAMALGVFTAYAWSGQFWIDLVDEGYFLDLAARVQGGALPYRDFESYYTPGIFYLHAAVFWVFGTNLLAIRLLMAVVRAGVAVLLYGLTRRVVSPPFAVLPFVAIAALDHWPIEPEPHPSWPALLAFLACMECVARHLADGRARWLALAGAASGLAFVFKQNVGAFACLGLATYLAARTWPRGRSVIGAAVVAAVSALLWPAMDGLTAFALWAPLVGALVTALWSPPASGSRPAELFAAGAGVATITLAWLIPLVAALGPGSTPFGLFVGSINVDGLNERFVLPTEATPGLALVAVWAPTGLALLSRGPIVGSRWSRRRILGLAVLASLAISLVPTFQGVRSPLTQDRVLAPWLDALDQSFGTLHLYVPSLAAWSALALLVLRARAPLGTDPVPWYLLFGALSLLGMYPRSDTAHAVVAGAPVLVAGAWALSEARRAVAPQGAVARQVAAVGALLIVPVLAVAPQVAWRYATLVSPPGMDQREPYVPLAVGRAPVLVPRQMADTVGGAVQLVKAQTPRGGALFAYPVAPLFNFLAERPNPTRFNHFLPGSLTRADVEQVVSALDAAQPRYVVWDHGGVIYWGLDPLQRPLTDYIWRCYQQVAAFHFYLVLERRSC